MGIDLTNSARMASRPFNYSTDNAMNKKLRDGVQPSIHTIKTKYKNGEYGHEVEGTIGALLEDIERLEGRLASSERQLDWYFTRSFDH